MNIVQYLTFLNFFSVSNVAPATPLESFLTLSHPTLAMFEANVVRRQVRRYLPRRIQRNALPLLRRPLVSLRLFLPLPGRHDSKRLRLLLIRPPILLLNQLLRQLPYQLLR